jgi:hypothetical protein
VMNMTLTKQRLAKYLPERYSVNKNRRLVLDNGFGSHGITEVTYATAVLETLKAVSSIQFGRGYKRRPDQG